MVQSIVHSEAEQNSIFAGLTQQMMEQGQLIGIPQIPGQIDMATGTTPPPAGTAGGASAKVPGGGTIGDMAVPGASANKATSMKTTDQSVTAGVANQGQLIPIASPSAAASDDTADLKRILSQVVGNQENPAAGADSGQKSDSGGTGDILSTVASVAMSFIGWIICTELMKQGKMPKKWWIKGAPIFTGYPEFVKQGYYLWAIPCVHHLRSCPDSVFSRILCVVFNARARSIAERPTIQGTLVTVILWPICWTIGAVLWLLNKRPDWTSVYAEKT